MNDEERALFDQGVRRVIRTCVIFTIPFWLPVLGAVGWLFTSMYGNVAINTKVLTKVETQVNFLVAYVKEGSS